MSKVKFDYKLGLVSQQAVSSEKVYIKVEKKFQLGLIKRFKL